MTIFQPNKTKRVKVFFLALFSSVALGGFFAIGLYNTSVSLRHEERDLSRRAEALELQNADLKNTLYVRLGAESLSAVAARLAFVHETRPSYLSFIPEKQQSAIAYP